MSPVETLPSQKCPQCGGTGVPDSPDAIGRCSFCGGYGQVPVYVHDDEDDDEDDDRHKDKHRNQDDDDDDDEP
jgi:hypothetical protein